MRLAAAFATLCCCARRVAERLPRSHAISTAGSSEESCIRGAAGHTAAVSLIDGLLNRVFLCGTSRPAGHADGCAWTKAMTCYGSLMTGLTPLCAWYTAVHTPNYH
jgi:hypothetical protein